MPVDGEDKAAVARRDGVKVAYKCINLTKRVPVVDVAIGLGLGNDELHRLRVASRNDVGAEAADNRRNLVSWGFEKVGGHLNCRITLPNGLGDGNDQPAMHVTLRHLEGDPEDARQVLPGSLHLVGRRRIVCREVRQILRVEGT